MVPGGVGFGEIKTGGPKVEKVGAGKLRIENQSFQIGNGGRMNEEMGWQDGDVLVIEGTIIIIGSAGEVVGFIGSAWFVDKFKVEFRHLREIVCYTAANFLWVSVVLQVRVVREDVNLMWGAHKQMTPSQ
jgi:hypothetical protein